ncbi:hypothetical protein MINTM005_13620 [Mycobacterium intracellulare]|uniref:ERF family protein n=1 Tax=Mycobacterium intracellulare TaxID=1767 RepID=UPI00192854C7|nr:ERF family protein [Mycobacterium intracellulare]BCO56118.1 hypothetical protein MINTM005_13620 [Mycobacterium intracellulare]
MELDQLAPALVAFQAELGTVEKSADNPFFKSKYAPLPEVRATLQPLLAKHKLALIALPAIIRDYGAPGSTPSPGVNGLRWILLHESGQHLEGEWMLTPKDHTPQGEGSDVTYKRRYGDMAITGLVADDDDDDGQAASAPPRKLAAAGAGSSKKAAKDLEAAKDKLREAIDKSGARPEDFVWVADAGAADIPKILEHAEALMNVGMALAN